jgi:hypothetical protein
MFWKLFWPGAFVTALVFGAPAHISPVMAFGGSERPSLPKEMVGKWCPVKDSDQYERRPCPEGKSDSGMILSKHGVFYFEEGCDFTKVQKLERNVYYVHGNCGGEGMNWKETMIIQLRTDDAIPGHLTKEQEALVGQDKLSDDYLPDDFEARVAMQGRHPDLVENGCEAFRVCEPDDRNWHPTRRGSDVTDRIRILVLSHSNEKSEEEEKYDCDGKRMAVTHPELCRDPE